MEKVGIERSHIDILLSHVEKTSVFRWKVYCGCQQRKRGREVGCDTRWMAQGSPVGMEVFCHVAVRTVLVDDNMTEKHTHMLDHHQCSGLTVVSTSVSCNQWRMLGERHMRFL